MENFEQWQRLQGALEPYRRKLGYLDSSDRILIEMIDKVVENYENLEARSLAIQVLADRASDFPAIVNMVDRKLFNSADRQQIINKLSKWTIDNLHTFNPKGRSISSSLSNWLYKRVGWWIHDLIQDPNRSRFIELDRLIGEDGCTSIGEIDNFANDTGCSHVVNRNGIDELIEKLQQEEEEHRSLKLPLLQQWLTGLTQDIDIVFQGKWQVRFINLVETDPDCKISSIFYQIEACNYQYLLRNLKVPLIAGNKPKKVQAIINELGSIEYHALNAHLTRTFDPWVEGFYLEILNDEEWGLLKEQIDEERQPYLIDNCRKNTPICNTHFLAHQILPCYQKTPPTWDDLTRQMKDMGWKGARPTYIEDFWNEKGRPTLGKMARQILEYQ
jgi:hypothetical protein